MTIVDVVHIFVGVCIGLLVGVVLGVLVCLRGLR